MMKWLDLSVISGQDVDRLIAINTQRKIRMPGFGAIYDK